MPKILNRVGTLTISLLINYVNQERALNTICKNRFLALSSLKTNSNALKHKVNRIHFTLCFVYHAP